MSIRWRLRFLFIGLMAAGLGWIYLGNYVRMAVSPLDYSTEATVTLWGGALVIGLLLDAVAGLHLRRFLAALGQRGGMPPTDAKAAARAIRFPERASLLLMTSSVLMIGVHRAVLYSGQLTAMLAEPDSRTRLLSSIARDLILALSLSLLLFIFSRRVLKPAVAAFGLREVPEERRIPIGLRLGLVVLALGVFNVTMIISAPKGIPQGRLLLYYLPPVLMTALVAYLIATDIGRDLNAIAGRLRVLATGVRPDLFHRFAVTDRDEIGELVASINALQDRVEGEFQAIERDLEAARKIQMGLLPRAWRPPPGWDLAARLLPAQEVGGDFYDVIDLGHGRFGIAVGDAAGKGLSAALLMASTVSLIRSHAPLHDRPGAVLAAVNRLLHASVPPLAFVTAVYAVVDTDRREVTVSSAGHLPPLVGGQEAEVLPSLPLGVEQETAYEDRTYLLDAGAPLLFFSDGLVEAADAMGELPDMVGLAQGLREGGRPAQALLGGVMQAFAAHLGGAAPPDDVTALVLLPPREERLELPSRHGSELTAASEAARFARENGMADREEDVATAVGEACLNAITHGNNLREEIRVGIRLLAGPGWLEFCVADGGPPFEPPSDPPDLAGQMDGEGPIRGWGMHLIRSMADEVRIEKLPAGKQIRLRFGSEARAD